MKKALTLVVLIVIPSIIFAQGTVVFNNNTGLVQQWTSSSDPTLAAVPVGGGYVQLIATTTGNPLLHTLGVYAGSVGFLPAYSSLAGFLAANPGWSVAYALPPDRAPLAPVPINAAPGIFNGGPATIVGVAGGLSRIMWSLVGPAPTQLMMLPMWQTWPLRIALSSGCRPSPQLKPASRRSILGFRSI